MSRTPGIRASPALKFNGYTSIIKSVAPHLWKPGVVNGSEVDIQQTKSLSEALSSL
jgi:hypothetical protein